MSWHRLGLRRGGDEMLGPRPHALLLARASSHHHYHPVWFGIFLVIGQYVPNSVITGPVERVWTSMVSDPWFKLHYYVRLAIGWLCLLGLVFGSAYGFPLEAGTTYGQRTQSVFGLFVFQLVLWIFSKNRKAIQWRTIIVGLSMQQILAM